MTPRYICGCSSRITAAAATLKDAPESPLLKLSDEPRSSPVCDFVQEIRLPTRVGPLEVFPPSQEKQAGPRYSVRSGDPRKAATGAAKAGREKWVLRLQNQPWVGRLSDAQHTAGASRTAGPYGTAWQKYEEKAELRGTKANTAREPRQLQQCRRMRQKALDLSFKMSPCALFCSA